MIREVSVWCGTELLEYLKKDDIAENDGTIEFC